MDPVESQLLASLVHEPIHRAAFLSRGVSAWMRTPSLREAALYVAGRSEMAEGLPSDRAPEIARQVLWQTLVSEGGPRSSYESLEAALRLRDLERQSSAVLREMRKASSRGDDEDVVRLQRRKMELDRTIGECRKQIGG
jgi:hypothetical protein